jgi:hypothetical protein
MLHKEEAQLRVLLKSLADSRQSLLRPENSLDEEVELVVHDSQNLERNIRRLINRINLTLNATNEGTGEDSDITEDELEVQAIAVRRAVCEWQRRVCLLVE